MGYIEELEFLNVKIEDMNNFAIFLNKFKSLKSLVFKSLEPWD